MSNKKTRAVATITVGLSNVALRNLKLAANDDTFIGDIASCLVNNIAAMMAKEWGDDFTYGLASIHDLTSGESWETKEGQVPSGE